MLTYYEILGLQRGCTQKEVQSARKELAKRNHPDQGGSQELMKLINLAADTLDNPELRAKYDQSLDAEAGGHARSFDEDAEENDPYYESPNPQRSRPYGGASNNPSPGTQSNYSFPKKTRFQFVRLWDFAKNHYFRIASLIQVIFLIIILNIKQNHRYVASTRLLSFAGIAITVILYAWAQYLEWNKKTGKTFLVLKIVISVVTILPVLYVAYFLAVGLVVIAVLGAVGAILEIFF